LSWRLLCVPLHVLKTMLKPVECCSVFPRSILNQPK
jgi:hypothetical protein